MTEMTGLNYLTLFRQISDRNGQKLENITVENSLPAFLA